MYLFAFHQDTDIKANNAIAITIVNEKSVNMNSVWWLKIQWERSAKSLVS